MEHKKQAMRESSTSKHQAVVARRRRRRKEGGRTGYPLYMIRNTRHSALRAARSSSPSPLSPSCARPAWRADGESRHGETRGEGRRSKWASREKTAVDGEEDEKQELCSRHSRSADACAAPSRCHSACRTRPAPTAQRPCLFFRNGSLLMCVCSAPARTHKHT